MVLYEMMFEMHVGICDANRTRMVLLQVLSNTPQSPIIGQCP